MSTARTTQLPSSSGVPWPPDTTGRSLVHRLVGYPASALRYPKLAKIYLASIAITYVPLLLAAVYSRSSLSLWTPPPDTRYSLPFLHDWNIAFTFLVSFPSLVVLLVTDDQVLSTALQRVQEARVLCIAETSSPKMAEWCKARFSTINTVAQGLGAGIGLVLGGATMMIYVPPTVGFWIASKGHLLPVGYAYLYCIVLLYALITIYVLRCIAFSVFLSEVVAGATIHLLPFHPDKCGGLLPVGRLGLRNQYTVSILGLNIVILTVVSLSSLPPLPSQYHLIVASVVTYLILGPIVFMVPLLPFRRGMLRTKAQWMGEIAQSLRIEFERLRVQIQTDHAQISKEDEDLVDRLRKIGSVIDELPVWPFDAGTLRRFASAYVVPLGFPLVGKALASIVHWLIPR